MWLRVVFVSICSLCGDVEKARAEAADNVTYLKPLRKHVERLEVPPTDQIYCSSSWNHIVKRSLRLTMPSDSVFPATRVPFDATLW